MRLVTAVTLFAFAAAACTCRRSEHGTTARTPTRPAFSGAQIQQMSDLAGHLHAFAVSHDGSIWHFREPGRDAKWTVEWLGGNAVGLPTVSYNSDGTLRIWTVGPDHAVSWNSQQQKGGWSGWKRVDTPPAAEVMSPLQPMKDTVIVVRGVDGSIDILSLGGPGAGRRRLVRVPLRSMSPPLVFAKSKDDLELIFATEDGSLISAESSSGKAEIATTLIRAPKVKGELFGARLRDSVLVVAREPSGALFSIRGARGEWTSPSHLPAPATGSFGRPTLFSFDGRQTYAMAPGPGGTFWISLFDGARWGDWRNLGLAARDGDIPAMKWRGRVVVANRAMLESMAKGFWRPQMNELQIVIDDVQPSSMTEGDTVTVKYTLRNRSTDPGGGTVSATWDKDPFVEQPPSFTPPLAPGASFQGSFTSAGAVSIKGGSHLLRVVYESVLEGAAIDIPGKGTVQLQTITQYAEADRAVQVLALTDPFPTDNPPVQTGSWSCAQLTADQMHSCGTGTCSGGNNAQTCPEDCPQPANDVRSYNSQDLCRHISGLATPPPSTIADVTAFIKAAAASGTRVRVSGNLHSSNAQICTDGLILSTSSLLGAAPATIVKRRGAAGYCAQYDCTASLAQADPIVETFEGVQTVRVGPGMRLIDLAEFLDKQNLSLGFGIPQFPDPTVGGAIATASHGSSPKFPSVISTRVRSVTLVKADGTIEEITPSSPQDLWLAARANLGFLGVVVQVRLAVEPAFNLHGTVDWKQASDLLAKDAPQSLVSNCDWGELLWFPSGGADDANVMRLCDKKTDATGSDELRLQYPEGSDVSSLAYPAIDLMQTEACNGQQACDMEKTRAETLRYYQPVYESLTDKSKHDCGSGGIKVGLDAPSELKNSDQQAGLEACGLFTGWLCTIFAECCTEDCTDGVTGRWHHMITSRITPARFRPFERDWEIYIPGNQAQNAIRYAKNYFRQNGICLPLVGVLLRFAPSEEGTLIAHTVKQGAFQLSSNPGMFFEMAIFLPKGMSCTDQAVYEKIYSDLAEALVSPPFNGRAHWGKNRRSLFQLQRRLGAYGDNMTRFRSVVATMDPTGMFANQFGVDMGLRWPRLAKPIPVDSDVAGCSP